jgi:hypothetical protein
VARSTFTIPTRLSACSPWKHCTESIQANIMSGVKHLQEAKAMGTNIWRKVNLVNSNWYNGIFEKNFLHHLQQ